MTFGRQLCAAWGASPRPQEDKTSLELPLHEMSADQLRTLAQKFEEELAQRAKSVAGVPETHKEAVGDALDPADELIGEIEDQK